MNPLKCIEYNERQGLFAPIKFWAMTESEIALIANGCGAKGINGKLVPDTMYGLDMSPVCDIHDCMYEWGLTEWDKLMADMVMLVNAVLWIIKHTKSKIMRALRCYRATTYFVAVLNHGDGAYWGNKDKEGNNER